MSKDQLMKFQSWPRFKEISLFYQLNRDQPAWLGKTIEQKELVSLVKMASSLGLNEGDYQGAFFKELDLTKTLLTRNDSVQADIFFTDAALHFFSDIKAGNNTPSIGYTGLSYSPDLSTVPGEILRHVNNGNLGALLKTLQPVSNEYNNVLKKLQWFQRVINEHSFKEAKIISTKADSNNKALLVRLYQLGITDSVMTSPAKKEVVTKVKLAQEQFDVLNDGVLRSTTLQALNVSLYRRFAELKLAVNVLRWLDGLKKSSSALVLNIPSANFYVYEKATIVMESRVVVGKKSTPTPTLSSTITEVILYPYWTVPQKIAVNEMLPLIKKNIGYLNAGNYQVLNKQGKVLNPYAINWHSLGISYFPYVIRQSTGCDNALGLVKFNFYNPFTVYLHDTPSKLLFSSARRFYSHGCMRVEKPEELAHYLLGSNRIAIDTLTAKGCINQQAPIVVSSEKKLPVVILYSTVWYNKNGETRFYDDVYGRFNSMREMPHASR